MEISKAIRTMTGKRLRFFCPDECRKRMIFVSVRLYPDIIVAAEIESI